MRAPLLNLRERVLPASRTESRRLFGSPLSAQLPCGPKELLKVLPRKIPGRWSIAAADLLLNIVCRLPPACLASLLCKQNHQRQNPCVLPFTHIFGGAPLTAWSNRTARKLQLAGDEQAAEWWEQRNKGDQHLGEILKAVSEAVGQMKDSCPGPFWYKGSSSDLQPKSAKKLCANSPLCCLQSQFWGASQDCARADHWLPGSCRTTCTFDGAVHLPEGSQSQAVLGMEGTSIQAVDGRLALLWAGTESGERTVQGPSWGQCSGARD